MKIEKQIDQLKIALQIKEAEARGEKLEWEWYSINEWISGEGYSYLACISHEDEIRLVPTKSKWEEAFERGEKIQNYWPNAVPEKWVDIHSLESIQWSLKHGYPLRIKPAPTLIPLGPEDVMPGDIVRWNESSDKNMITFVQTDKVYLSNYGPRTYCELKKEFKRLVNGAWINCSKIKEAE